MWHLWVEKNSPMGKDQQRFLAHILTSNNEEKVIKVFFTPPFSFLSLKYLAYDQDY